MLNNTTPWWLSKCEVFKHVNKLSEYQEFIAYIIANIYQLKYYTFDNMSIKGFVLTTKPSKILEVLNKFKWRKDVCIIMLWNFIHNISCNRSLKPESCF